jgi:hypothetical protein
MIGPLIRVHSEMMATQRNSMAHLVSSRRAVGPFTDRSLSKQPACQWRLVRSPRARACLNSLLDSGLRILK